MRGQKIKEGTQIGDLTCLKFVGYDGASPIFRWRCVCGEEMDLRNSSVRYRRKCTHGADKRKITVYSPSHVKPYELPANSPCRKCSHEKRDNCTSFKNCERWLGWFSDEWQNIKKTLGREN